MTHRPEGTQSHMPPRTQSRTPSRTPSRLLAAILLVAMAAMPPVMTWAAGSPMPMGGPMGGPMGNPMASETAGHHHHLPSAPDQRPHDDCCDLCLTNCIACIGLIGLPATAPYHAVAWVVPAVATQRTAAPATPDRHRLPFPLGPPTLLA